MIENGMEDPTNELNRWIWEWGCVDGILHCLWEQGCAGAVLGKGTLPLGTRLYQRLCCGNEAVGMRLWGCCVGSDVVEFGG